MIPIPDAIPVNWWWFEILLIATFFIHLLLMNALLGSSLIVAYQHIRFRRSSLESSSIPTLIALTVNFGVPPLLFVQVLYGQFFYSSSVIVGIPWLLVIPFLIIAYYAAYLFVFKRGVSDRFAAASIVTSIILILFIGFMMTNNYTLMLVPEKWTLYFKRPDGAGFNMGEATLIPRYLHFIIASVAVGGLWKAVYNRYSNKGAPDQVDIGLKIAGWATLVQMFDGFWFLLSLPSEIMWNFLGGDIPSTILLIFGILLALHIVFSALKGQFSNTFISILAVILLMVINRDQLRRFYLQGIFSPSELPVTGEYGSLILFLVVFVAGIAVIASMFSLLFKPGEGEAQ